MITKVLQRPTLVLNRNWQPVNVATVARALVLLWNESARVVDPADYQLYTWEDWSKLRPRDGERFIQAVRFRLRVPEVVTLTGYDRLPAARVTFSRRNMFKRDHYTCQYCGAQPGSEELTLDHVVPRRRAASRAGRTACWRAWPATSGRPTARRSRPACGCSTKPVRPTWKPLYADPRAADRKLVEVRQRGVLERRAARSSRYDQSSRPGRPGAITRVCSWESRRLSKACRTGFDSSHSCLCRRGRTAKAAVL